MEEEERTAAAEAVEAREPGVFRLGGGRGDTDREEPRPNTRTRTRTTDDGQTRHRLTPERDACGQSHAHRGGVRCVWVERWGWVWLAAVFKSNIVMGGWGGVGKQCRRETGAKVAKR